MTKKNIYNILEYRISFIIRSQTLFSFPEEAVNKAASKDSCKIVVSIEMSMGQMVEDVERSVMGKRPVKWYGKYGKLRNVNYEFICA